MLIFGACAPAFRLHGNVVYMNHSFDPRIGDRTSSETAQALCKKSGGQLKTTTLPGRRLACAPEIC